MITFQGRNQAIRQADRITRSVNSIYPHVYVSSTSAKISDKLLYYDNEYEIQRRLQDLQLKHSSRIDALQFRMTSGMDLFRKIIEALKDKKIGNCYESARMAEIIAKINGQHNIYPMRMFISRNRSGALMPLEHVVSLITDKKIEPDLKYSFRNNDAIILDPWLGLTEYVSRYIEKIKYDFKNLLPKMPDIYFGDYISTKNAKNLKEHKCLKKTNGFKPDIRFELHFDDIVSKEQAEQLRKENPDLILDNFSNILLEKKDL